MSEHLKEEAIVPYLDGRLSAVEREQLDTHLASCGECRERVNELRALMGVLAEWELDQPTPSFDAALRARLAEEAEQGIGWLTLRPAYAFWASAGRPIYGAALAAAVVIAAAVALWPPTTVELPPLPQAPGVAQAPRLSRPTAPSLPPASQSNGNDTLAVLDNSVLLENYDMLTQFDILFEPTAEEKEGKTL